MDYGNWDRWSMNLVESTKRLLKSYNSLRASIANIRDQIENMEYTGLRTTKIDGMPHNSNNSSITEIEALIMISKKEVLYKNLKKNEAMLRIIDRSINVLDDIEKVVIINYYLKEKNWDEISVMVTYSPRSCMRIRDNALVKLSGAIYGHFDLLEK